MQINHYLVSIYSNLLDLYSNEYENKVVLEVIKCNFLKLAAYERVTLEKLHYTADEVLVILRNVSGQLFFKKSLDCCFCHGAVYYKLSCLTVSVTEFTSKVKWTIINDYKLFLSTSLFQNVKYFLLLKAIRGFSQVNTFSATSFKMLSTPPLVARLRLNRSLVHFYDYSN